MGRAERLDSWSRRQRCLGGGLFTVAAGDNIDHNFSSSTAISLYFMGLQFHLCSFQLMIIMRLVIGETNTSMQLCSSVVGIISSRQDVESDEAMMTLLISSSLAGSNSESEGGLS